jgi:hypothetical protein
MHFLHKLRISLPDKICTALRALREGHDRKAVQILSGS